MPQSTLPHSILVVDDDELLRISMAYTLEQAGYRVQVADSAESAIEIVEKSQLSLVLLDISLPGMTGLEAIRRIRDICPVIFVSGRRRELDEVLGLELGAEDFVNKPFAPEVLLARIRTVLRRDQIVPPTTQPVSASPLIAGDLQIDITTYTATCGGKPVSLSPLEFRLLYTMVQEQGRVISTEELLRRVWGENYVGEPQVIYVYIRTLREKLEENPQSPTRILTVRGVGYRLVPQELAHA